MRDSVQLTSNRVNELQLMWLHAVSRDTHAIGWLPKKAFTTRAEQGDVTAIYRNDDLVGWILTAVSRHTATLRIYQIWVRPDARCIEHGRALIDHVSRRADAAACCRLEAWVAEDLEANVFWRAIGFVRKNWRWGKGEKPRRVYRWTQPVLHLAENHGNTQIFV